MQIPLSESILAESESLFRSLQDRKGLAETLHGLADIYYRQNNFAKSSQFVEESIAIFNDLGNRHGLAQALQLQGKIAYCQQDYVQQILSYQQRATVCLQQQNFNGVVDSLESIAQGFEAMGSLSIAKQLTDIMRSETSLHGIVQADILLEHASTLIEVEMIRINKKY